MLLINPDLTAAQIAAQLSPPQRLDAVETALMLLQEVGLINLVKDKWLVSQKNISTGENFVANSVVHFHKQVLGLAADSLDRYARDEREISASTVALTKSQFEIVRKKIRELRLDILAMSEASSAELALSGTENSDLTLLPAADSSCTKEIYQINLQTFPLTQIAKTKKDSYEN